MIAALVLVLAVGAAIIVLGAPWLLTRGSWHVHRPRLALAAWSVAVAAGLATLASSVALSLAVATRMIETTPVESVILTLGAWTAVFVLAWLFAMTASTTEQWSEGSTLRERRALRAELPRRRIGQVEVFVMDDPHPAASSFGGWASTIIVTTGAIELLTPEQLRAVVAHERAHITDRHHALRALAALQAAVLPWVPATRMLNRATRLLVELAADEVAARKAGAVHLANALARMADATGDASMHLRAERLAGRAWRPGRGAVQSRGAATAH